MSEQNTATYDDTDYTFVWEADQSLLQALLAAEIPAKFSCQEGKCGACQVYVEGGETHMKRNRVLPKPAVDAGITLACQTYRDSDGPFEVAPAL